MSAKRSVYKKNSPNNKLVVYLVQRDIFDDLQSVDPIEGVVTMDKNSLKNAKVFARIRCTFRYGEQQLDEVLSGVTFYKEFFIQTLQIYPMENNLSDVFGEVQIFAGETAQSTSSKRNTISLAIRRLTLAIPKLDADVYTKQVVKPFHFHSGQLQITATLPKEIFFHGESIEIHLTIDNASSNVVRRLKLQVIQTVEITLFKQRTTRCTVIDMEVEKGFPIESQTAGWTQSYHLRPSLQDTRQQAGLALDGKLKHHDTNLASSTLIKDYRKKESMGIVVQYMIRIKVVTGFGGRDVQLEIPFILCHPRKEQEVVKAEAATNDLVIEKFKRPKAKRLASEDVDSN
ncbi:unnamed protein product [Trichobilharzia szidati]|nr:unnamed protein product [Trichobilharzia szidati]